MQSGKKCGLGGEGDITILSQYCASAVQNTRTVAQISSRLVLTLQVDYSYDQVDYDDEDLSERLFTGSEFDDDDLTTQRTLTALLRLQYQLGNSGVSPVLAGRGSGSGSVRGFVFVDQNGDGVRQTTEPGVSGLTVFLNSVYPTVTDARGEYRFPQVGLGSHFLFIDESTLPLPWTLVRGEYSPFDVQLRRATRLDIPVSPMSLTDEELLEDELAPAAETIARSGT